jgi:hypothetical protein
MTSNHGTGFLIRQDHWRLTGVITRRRRIRLSFEEIGQEATFIPLLLLYLYSLCQIQHYIKTMCLAHGEPHFDSRYHQSFDGTRRGFVILYYDHIL